MMLKSLVMTIRKNGPDRLVNGQFIQTKYCQTAKDSINAGFDKKDWFV